MNFVYFSHCNKPTKIFSIFSKKVVDISLGTSYTNKVADKQRHLGIIAQLGEHLPYKQGVTGSSPVGPTSRNIVIIKYGEIAQLARAYGSYP